MMFPRALGGGRDRMDVRRRITELGGFQASHERAYLRFCSGMGIRTFTLSDEIETRRWRSIPGRQRDRRSCWMRRNIRRRFATRRTAPFRRPLPRVYAGPITRCKTPPISRPLSSGTVLLQGTPTEKKVDYHRGINKPIHYNSKLYERLYGGWNMNALLDGYQGRPDLSGRSLAGLFG